MKCVLFANTDWYLYNFRRSLANALREADWDVLLVAPAGPYGDKLKDMGFRFIAAPMDRRSLNPFREAALLIWLWRLLRKEKPELIHGFTIKSAIYAALAGQLAGVACVSAFEGLGYVFIANTLKARLLRPLVRMLMRIALGGKRVGVILLNRDDRALFVKNKLVSSDKIRLIPGAGVDCSKFRASTRVRRDGELPCVLYVGRMLWDKGIGEFVDAARIIKAEGRNLRFLLAGAPDPGNPASIPKATIEEWSAAGLVQWLGHVDDIPALLASSDIFVLPSYREGLPTSLIEAAACARPLVATNAPGCREVIEDGRDGLLVPVGESKPLAKAILRLADDTELAHRLAAAARAKALSQFDVTSVIQKTLALYRELAPTEFKTSQH